jgi:Domain of unknown function (DUF4350)
VIKERLLVLALAAGAFGLFYVLFFPQPQAGQSGIALPLSTESRPEGYLAVWRWLAEQRIPATSLRYRYDRLSVLLPKSTGNLLLVSMPQQVPAREAELAELKSWVERGNTLLIMAAIVDSPPWILNSDPLLADRLEDLTGLHLDTPSMHQRDLKMLIRDRLGIHPRGAHALIAEVRQITAVSTLPLRSAQLRGRDDTMPLELAARNDSGDPTLWLVRRGSGQIVLSAVASPFSNGAVALADNARLLANIVSWCREAGGTVVFDDAHQGGAAYYDGKAFFADPRLHRTLGWIVLLWLALVLGALPLRAAQRAWRPLDEAAYAEASARYFAAVVPPSAAAQRLIESFLRSQPVGSNSAHEPALWERFDADPRVPAGQRHMLHTLYERACAGKRVDLVRLQNLLAELRRNIG